MKIKATIKLCLDDNVMYHVMDVMDEESLAVIWVKLESQYVSRLLSNKFYLKEKLFGFKMLKSVNLNQHVQLNR